jgi:hypothetical protein
MREPVFSFFVKLALRRPGRKRFSRKFSFPCFLPCSREAVAFCFVLRLIVLTRQEG